MKRVILMMGFLVLLLVPTSAVLADSHETVIEEGEVINNDVIVFDGDLAIQPGAVVNGDVVVFNGDAKLEGTVNGDVVLFNGDIKADGEAAISGDCVLLNGDLDDESTSGLNCTHIGAEKFGAFMSGFGANGFNADAFVPPIPTVPPVPTVPGVSDVTKSDQPDGMPPVERRGGEGGSFFGGLLAVLSSGLLAGLIAFVAAAVLPNHVGRVQAAAKAKPAVSGAVGLLTAVAVPSIASLLLLISTVLIIVCIGLIGFPLVLLMLLAYGLAIMLGWVAMGSWLGTRLFGRKGRSFAVSTALGTMLMTFGIGLMGLIPFMFGETLLTLVISAVGLGAVALTQFGMKPYPREAVAGATGDDEPFVEEDAEKVSAVMETLHIEIDDKGGLN